MSGKKELGSSSKSTKRGSNDGSLSPSSRSTVGGPTRGDARAFGDALEAKMQATADLAEAVPFNANKALEYGSVSAEPPVGGTAAVSDLRATGSSLTETISSEKVGAGKPHLGTNPGNMPLVRLRVDASAQRLTTNPGRSGSRQSALAEGWSAWPGAARRFRSSREDHSLRSRAHSGAHRARARLRRPRLLRMLRADDEGDARFAVRGSGQTNPRVRQVFYRGGRTGLGRYRARRPRICGEVLHRRRQLGSGRKQHPGVLHSRRNEISRSHPRRKARAAFSDAPSGDGARHLLGLRFAHAGVDAHAPLGHVGSRAAAVAGAPSKRARPGSRRFANPSTTTKSAATPNASPNTTTRRRSSGIARPTSRRLISFAGFASS